MSFSLTIPALGSSARRRLGREFCGLTRRYVQSGAGVRLDTPPFPPSARHPLYSTLRPRSQTLLHAGVWAAYSAALCAVTCRAERERVCPHRPFSPASATPYTAPCAPVARPFCTPAFGPRILRPYALLRAERSGSVSARTALSPQRPPLPIQHLAPP